MKLLIKLNFENDYNLFKILDSFYEKLYNDNVTFLLNINEELIIDEDKLNGYDNLFYYKESIYPNSDFINSNIDSIEWDIILTSNKLFKPVKKGFDDFIIKNSVKDITWWKDKNGDNPSVFSIKREYYDKFGWVFNPSYNSPEYSIKEFKEISSILKNSLYMQYHLVFELINFDEDEYTYERRKIFNFSLLSKNKEEIKKDDSDLIKLNDFVDKVYCINLDDRPDRWKSIQREFERVGINADRFSAVDGKNLKKGDLKIKHNDLGNQIRGAQGALRSHRSVLREAILMDYDRILVFEDDLIFCDDFNERFDYYANNVPKDWDIMYLGCHFNGCPDPRMVKTYIYKNEKNYGCFAMILNKEMIKYIYDMTEPEERTIDDYISEIVKNFNVYSFIPFFVKTTLTVSDISTIKEEFEYDVVNKYFNKKILLYKGPGKTPPPVAVKTKTISPISPKLKTNYSDKDIMNRYVMGNQNFDIMKAGNVIFSSTNNSRGNLRLYDSHFEVYGRRFEYQGIGIKIK